MAAVTGSRNADEGGVTIRQRPRGAPLTFCDVSCLYAPTGGGIRTYQQAKLRWFAAQERHAYVLLHPAASATVEQVSRSVRIITVRGVEAGRGGYYLPVDLPAISSWIRRLEPDVLETGDPWFSGPLGLLAKRRGHTRLVSSFFHGNPIDTYVQPWSERGRGTRLRRATLARAARYFFRVQRMYDLTVTSSQWVESMLHQRGVRRVVRSHFGADPAFFEVGRCRVSTPARRRLLYAGRLQNDKGIDLLVEALPEILARTDAEITIAGAGPARTGFKGLEGPRVRLIGYVRERSEMARLFSTHDVLVAPGPHETFGLAALEGLAAGLAVVGPDAGGTFELLSQLPHAYTFPSGDADGLVLSTVAAIRSSSVAAEAEAATHLARHYGTWSDAIAKGVDTYCRYLSHCTM